MRRRRWKKILGEFGVIVAGVLVALAVDDFRQYLGDRATEAQILERVIRDVERDLDDLDRVISRAERRTFVADALLRALGDPGAAPETPYSPRRAWTDSSRTAFEVPFEPTERPLREFTTWTEFDLSDATYREVLQTGAIRVVRREALRERVSDYYFRAVDASRSDQRNGVAQEHIVEALAKVGIVPTDRLSLSQVVALLATHEQSPVELRQFRYLTQRQLATYLAAFDRAQEFRLQLRAATGS